jgi:hypothetical protein
MVSVVGHLLSQQMLSGIDGPANEIGNPVHGFCVITRLIDFVENSKSTLECFPRTCLSSNPLTSK